jgi:hypothetical protein
MHEALDLLDGPGTRIDVGAAQFRREQVPAAEDVERQVAVAIIVAVEEAAFLMPMDRVVGRVQVQDDVARGLALTASRKRSTNTVSIAAASCPIL